MTRPISRIALEIYIEWDNVYYAARPYLNAMTSLETVDDRYDQDSAADIIRYFLANARFWRGDVARRIKKELNDLLKEI